MSLWKDVQFSLRTMRKSPRIALTVLATLTLGIGANTAIFSVVNAALLKPLPFHDPGELVELNADLRGLGARNVGFSVPELDDLRDRAGIFSAVPSTATEGRYLRVQSAAHYRRRTTVCQFQCFISSAVGTIRSNCKLLINRTKEDFGHDDFCLSTLRIEAIEKIGGIH
jgi:hypothetical protein